MTSLEALLSRYSANLNLGVHEIDQTHLEFIVLVQKLQDCPANQFGVLFYRLVEHTRTHFESEEKLMLSLSHGLLTEHRNEHNRVLGDMNRFAKSIEKGRLSMARAWVNESLLDWFENHTATMDSALAADLVSNRVCEA